MQGTDQGSGAGQLTRRTAIEIDKDRDRMRTHLSDALGYLLWQDMQACSATSGRAAAERC